MNVIQPPDSSFIPGVVGSVRDLVENYDAVVEALEAWPHDPEKAAEVRLDGETMRCYAARLQ